MLDKLWAPWRMEYIEKVDAPGCFLCDALASNDDRENFLLYRGSESFVIMNRYPYNSGHLMVVPNAHTPSLLELTDSCRSEILLLAGKSKSILEETIGSQGFNCGWNIGQIAGAGVRDHFHLHIVPRWAGDVNFFPVLSDTKSIPEYLGQTYDRLVGAFAKIG